MFSAESFGVAGFVGIVVTDGLADLLRYHAGHGPMALS
jgi:hypothetical protein